MSIAAETGEDVLSWLGGLRLPQYASCFREAGYLQSDDCVGMTDERLQEVGVFPTGHRRRILRSLEWLEATGERRVKPVPKPRHIFPKDRKRATMGQRQPASTEAEEVLHPGGQALTLPPGAGLGGGPELEVAVESRETDPSVKELPVPRDGPGGTRGSASSSSDSLSVSSPSEQASDRETSSEDPVSSAPAGFQGTMVLNDIYDDGWNNNDTPLPRPQPRPRPTRSYKLRHRPVPEIPSQTILPPADRSPQQHNDTQQPSATTQGPTGLNTRQKAPLVRTLSPICPYGETFLYNNPESILDSGTKEMFKNKISEKIKHKKPRKKHKSKGPGNRAALEKEASDPEAEDLPEDVYATVEECNSSLKGMMEERKNAATPPVPWPRPQSFGDPYSLAQGMEPGLADELSISPYACFYDSSKAVLKEGWLDKLSPQGNCVYQRRWVKFDGENISYYNNDKEMYSKGLVPISAVTRVRGLGDNKFEVVTSLRTFVFRVENEGDKCDWINALQIAMRTQSSFSQKPSKCNANMWGYAELRGCKGRVFVSLMGSKLRLCKTEQDFTAGLAITVVDLTSAHVRDVERRGFEITTPFKNFCFTAESEREKGNYEVAEKIWFNESNRSCADCLSPQPEWASINLGVVFCKKCAGQHRFLGSSISQVRSLKLDSSIWSNELVELFLDVGNKKANSFWASRLTPEETLHQEAVLEQRAIFIRKKYKERMYAKTLTGFTSQEQLNKALCAAVVQSDVLETMSLVFSGADVMCATGDPTYCTPYLLAQRAGQRLQMEFLYHNKLSDFPKLDPVYEKRFPRDASVFLHGFLYKSVSNAKSAAERKGREEMARVWCTLEGGFLSYYESENTAAAMGRVDVSEVVSLAVNREETMTGSGAVFTFETYLLSERSFLFGTETQEAHRDWAQAIAKCFFPPAVVHMLSRDYDLIGRLYYKEGHDLYHWRLGWFLLENCSLFYSSGDEDEEEGELQLKRLQELTVSTHTEGEERKEVLLMVESGRTVYIHGYTRLDFALWHTAIQQAAGTDGRALGSQQLSRNNIPMVVDSCIAFATQYGLCQEGVYQKSGDPQRVAQLLDSFRTDARSVKLRVGDHQLEDVTDVLKNFLSETEDAILTKELYPYWVSVLDLEDEKLRVEKYRTFIQSLPHINRTTLAALLQHLYRIQKCSVINQMQTGCLASIFSTCLFQTGGHTKEEVRVVEDLINNYVELFDVHEDQVKQMETENSFITKWKDTMFSPAGDLIFEVYLERKEPESCCLIKVSPTMRADELADVVLEMRNVAVDEADLWTTFEVIENGDLERPLHYKEKVLEQVLEWGSLEDPSSAFLLLKKFCGAKMAESNQGFTKEITKGDNLKFKDGSSKLLSGHKFQDRYAILLDGKLCIYKDMKSAKPEREVPVSSVKCYLGLKRRLKQATSWGFTVCMEKQQWYLSCETKESQISWVTDILRAKFGEDLWPSLKRSRPPAVQKNSRGGAVLPATSNAQSAEPKRIKEKEHKMEIPKSYGREKNADGSIQHKTALLSACLKQREVSPYPSSSSSSSGSAGKWRSAPPGPVDGQRPLQRKSPVQAQMPPGLLHELSSVLNKTGRRAREASE
ncbi:hypothetical protein COCON_G00119220 [Conger conger]|uniref:Arf-GAP with Rho-GAP domain, ANK repeat and PH domain-containing protein 2 n=1 Tax=Conger conger TaxID=82655 RepID=A0A9Q1DHB3_CONCO|nr:hypothetical protein COCON_G00119220 [Conger conger]